MLQHPLGEACVKNKEANKVGEMIKKAKLNDLEMIVKYKLKMFEDAKLKGLLSNDAYDQILNNYQTLYKEGKAQHFISVVKGFNVGCAGAFLKNDLPYCFYKQSVYGFIGDVYTLPAYRNKGHADRLSKNAIEWLRKKGIQTIRLLASEQAKSLYKKHGFSVSDEMILNLN